MFAEAATRGLREIDKLTNKKTNCSNELNIYFQNFK